MLRYKSTVNLEKNDIHSKVLCNYLQIDYYYNLYYVAIIRIILHISILRCFVARNAEKICAFNP